MTGPPAGGMSPGRRRRRGARMLASHADLCPFSRAGQITEVRVEPTLAVHDTDANVIVIAKPDLLYLEDGAWVWREIKTRAIPCAPPRTPSGSSRSSRSPPCSWRRTRWRASGTAPASSWSGSPPTAATCCSSTPSDPAQVARAREVIHELAAPWHADETVPARPGPHCTDCPVRRWCPDAQTEETA